MRYSVARVSISQYVTLHHVFNLVNVLYFTTCFNVVMRDTAPSVSISQYVTLNHVF